MWADDKDTVIDGNIHANFKLSSNGEILYLVNSEGNIADAYEFGVSEPDMAFARIPNGTGTPIWQSETFGYNNETITDIADAFVNDEPQIYPNPITSHFQINFQDALKHEVEIYTLVGELQWKGTLTSTNPMMVSDWNKGVYIVKFDDSITKIIIQ